jgi:hypothetical protein
MLTCIEFVVAAMASVEGLVNATLNDHSLLDNEDLIRTPDGGKAMSYDKSSATPHKIARGCYELWLSSLQSWAIMSQAKAK